MARKRAGHPPGNPLTNVLVASQGTVTNTYNGASRLTGTTNTGTPTTFISGAHYNALGERTSQTLGNGLTETWGYDDRARISSYSLKNGSTTDYSYSLSYFPNDNVMTANDSINGNWAYGYDDLNRMTSASVSANGGVRLPASWTYVYDRFGNRWQQNVTSGSGPSSSLSFDANNHIIGSGITYDAAGNVTDDGTNTYTYDAEERIASVPSQSANFYYDGDGRRGVVYATACNFCQYPYWYRIYDLQDQMIGRCSPTYGCVNNEYYEGNRHLVSFTELTLFDHPDWLGTDRYRTETNATNYGYCLSDPFGDGLYCPEADGEITEIHFVGKELDNGNTESPDLLYNFGARYYAYWLGRFMSPDWSDGETETVPSADFEDPQTLNLYAYVRNNPPSLRDPDGHDHCHGAAGSTPDECTGNGGYWVLGNEPQAEQPMLPGNILILIQARQMATPGVNLAYNGLKLFGNVVSFGGMTAAECIAGSPECSALNIGLALIPGLPELKGLGLALNEEKAIGGVLKQIADGTTKGKDFLNTAGKLPVKAVGYYREFTVPLTGQSGRGAARLVTGLAGEVYYTADHYLTFTRIK
jgi:RHS repeat-associated protein